MSVSATDEKRRELVAGMPVIHFMEVATLKETLTRVARFEKLDGRKTRKTKEKWKPRGRRCPRNARAQKVIDLSTITGVLETH